MFLDIFEVVEEKKRLFRARFVSCRFKGEEGGEIRDVFFLYVGEILGGGERIGWVGVGLVFLCWRFLRFWEVAVFFSIWF